MKLIDFIVVGTLLFLAIIPDPTDILDFGLPILEPILAVAYLWFKPKEKSRGKKAR